MLSPQVAERLGAITKLYGYKDAKNRTENNTFQLSDSLPLQNMLSRSSSINFSLSGKQGNLGKTRSITLTHEDSEYVIRDLTPPYL